MPLEPSPSIRMSAAFAREADARSALSFLASCGHVLSSTLRPIAGAGGRVDVIVLDVEVADLAPERMVVVMTGTHGVVMSNVAVDAIPPAPAPAPGAPTVGSRIVAMA